MGDFPAAPAGAIRSLVGWAERAFGDRLVSVVVHGSLAFGCWGPASDIDVLIVIEDGAGVAEFHRLLVAGENLDFELSVLTRAAAAGGAHPIEFRYHFSRGRPEGVFGGRDPDLAGHLLVAWTVGVAVFGLPAREVLRRVGDAEFLASISADVLESCAAVRGLSGESVPVPVYPVLNFARTLAWLRDRAVRSKRDGGRWLRERRPEFAALATAALDEYAEPAGREVRTADVQRLADVVRAELPG